MLARIFVALALTLGLCGPAFAQAERSPPEHANIYFKTTTPGDTAVSPANPLPVNASVSASIGAYQPTPGYATLTATGSSARAALPTGTTVVLYNSGTTTVSCTLGSSSVVATTNEDQLPAGGFITYAPAGGQVDGACIDQTGSASNLIVISGGSGLPAGVGGAGSGGGGGAVFGPTAVGSAAANPPVLVAGTANAGATGNVQVWKVDASGNGQVGVTSSTLPIGAATSALQSTINTTLGSPFQAGGSIGNTSFGVTGALPAGTNLLGKVGIDQTTPGTTNGVQVNAALPAGTNSIGTVQPGNTANTTPWLVQNVGGTTGGLTMATVTAANSTNATNLKASAGSIYHMSGYNNSATLAWVSLYNTSGTPTCGSSIVYQMMIPANSTSGGGAIEDIPDGLNFSSGIGYCITTGIAGTGSVAATSYVVNFGYK